MARNPPWTRDELILALDLYHRVGRKHEGPAHPDVIALSEALNRLPIHEGHGEATFRNPSGVAMKLGNFLAHDPEYAGSGLSRGNRLEAVVWAEFSSNPSRLSSVARAIIAAGPEATEAPAEDGDSEAVGGSILMRVHRGRERSRKLANRRKENALKEQGALICEACGFDYERVYGERGRGFIECHHTRPLHTLVAGSRTRLQDLALLCANCHRMVHSARPWLSVEELRGILRA